MTNNNTRKNVLNIFNLPTQFVSVIAGKTFLGKAKKVSETTMQYMFYCKKDDTNCYQVAIASWDRAKYSAPQVSLHSVDMDSRKDTFVRFMQDDNKKGIIRLCDEYDAWYLEKATQAIEVENLFAMASDEPENVTIDEIDLSLAI